VCNPGKGHNKITEPEKGTRHEKGDLFQIRDRGEENLAKVEMQSCRRRAVSGEGRWGGGDKYTISRKRDQQSVWKLTNVKHA